MANSPKERILEKIEKRIQDEKIDRYISECKLPPGGDIPEPDKKPDESA